MARSNTRRPLDHRSLDAVEAAVLAPRIGETFDAVVLSAGGMSRSTQARRRHGAARSTRPSRRVCDGHLEPGTDVRVRLVEADIATGTVRFDAWRVEAH